jgi:magnesium-transporting ATPase (P-type)
MTLRSDISSNTFSPRPWQDLRIGDVVRVNGKEYMPCDLLLLGASSPTEVYVEMSCFDGDQRCD